MQLCGQVQPSPTGRPTCGLTADFHHEKLPAEQEGDHHWQGAAEKTERRAPLVWGDFNTLPHASLGASTHTHTVPVT